LENPDVGNTLYNDLLLSYIHRAATFDYFTNRLSTQISGYYYRHVIEKFVLSHLVYNN